MVCPEGMRGSADDEDADRGEGVSGSDEEKDKENERPSRRCGSAFVTSANISPLPIPRRNGASCNHHAADGLADARAQPVCWHRPGV